MSERIRGSYDDALYKSIYTLLYFTLPNLYLALPLGVTPSEFRRDLWQRKTRVPGLPSFWYNIGLWRTDMTTAHTAPAQRRAVKRWQGEQWWHRIAVQASELAGVRWLADKIDVVCTRLHKSPRCTWVQTWRQSSQQTNWPLTVPAVYRGRLAHRQTSGMQQ